jgi:hypothetical protein
MKGKFIIQLLVFCFLVNPFSSVHSSSFQKKVDTLQQEIPFLITPYYGHKTLNSRFDHRFPTYGENDGTFVRYDGNEWTEEVEFDTCKKLVGNCYDGHDGLDISMSYEPVLAAADGIVIENDWDNNSNHDSGLGLYIRIEHFEDGNSYTTYYGHMTTIAVTEGQWVMAGQVIGTSGSSGFSSGPHLHFVVQVWVDGDYRVIDPFGWNPAPGAPFQVDPWANSASGAESWCMWSGGEWATLCDPSLSDQTIPQPEINETFIAEDTTETSPNFSKGYGGRWNNPCSGTYQNGCNGWYEANVGSAGHAYYTPADGGQNEDHWAKWLPWLNISGVYDVYVWVPTIAGLAGNTFSWQAKYSIVDALGNTSSALVDEFVSEDHNPRDKWLHLGTYYLDNTSYVYTTDATGEANNVHCPDGPSDWCRMTVDAIKFDRRKSSFFPIIKKEQGWLTSVLQKNKSDGWSPAQGLFFSGNELDAYYNLGFFAQGIHTYMPSYAYDGSAILAAHQDSPGLAQIFTNNYQEQAIYTRIVDFLPQNSNPGWESAGPILYAPTVKRDYYGRSTTLEIFNVGATGGNIQVIYYSPSGSSRVEGPFWLPAAGQIGLSPSGTGHVACPTAGTICSAKIITYEDLDLTGVALEYNQADGLVRAAYNLFNVGASTVYFPVVKYNYYSMKTGLRIQNLGSNSTGISVKFYNQSGNYICSLPTQTVFSMSGVTFDLTATCPGAGFLGTAEAISPHFAPMGRHFQEFRVS